jgi:hypothetical protein
MRASGRRNWALPPADPRGRHHAGDRAAGWRQVVPCAPSSVPQGSFEASWKHGLGIPLCAAADQHILCAVGVRWLCCFG